MKVEKLGSTLERYHLEFPQELKGFVENLFKTKGEQFKDIKINELDSLMVRGDPEYEIEFWKMGYIFLDPMIMQESKYASLNPKIKERSILTKLLSFEGVDFYGEVEKILITPSFFEMIKGKDGKIEKNSEHCRYFFEYVKNQQKTLFEDSFVIPLYEQNEDWLKIRKYMEEYSRIEKIN
jgi:hypothetical protein